jgi:hypothetical protein
MRRGTNDRRRGEHPLRRSRLPRAIIGSAVAGLSLAILVNGGSASATLRHNPPLISEVCGSDLSLTGIYIGQPYVCSYAIQNTDAFQDAISLSAINDVVLSDTGVISSGNILSSLDLIFEPGIGNPGVMPSCTGGSGLGTVANPYIGATLCTIPWDAGIESANFSFYSASPLDYDLPGHLLGDTVTFTWQSLCSSPGGSGISCPLGNQFIEIGGSLAVRQLASDSSSQILTSSDMPVTGPVAFGTSVHDSVTVSPDPADPAPSPTPTGLLTINWFTNGSCSAAPAASSAPLTLGPSGNIDAAGFSVTPTSGGQYSFQPTYDGDPANPAYSDSVGVCEPFSVVAPQAITSPSTVSGTAHSPFSFTVTTIGNSVPSILERGRLPRHLTFTNNGNGTASLTGTPIRPGIKHIKIEAIFGAGPTRYVVSQAFTITIGR